jgi:hypothetical protein
VDAQLVIATYRLSFGVDGEDIVGVKALSDVEKPLGRSSRHVRIVCFR